jgi:hypothetical protein
MDTNNLLDQLAVISKSCEDLKTKIENKNISKNPTCQNCSSLTKKLNRDNLYYNNVIDHINELGELVIFMFLFICILNCIFFLIIRKQMRMMNFLNKRSRTKSAIQRFVKLPQEMKM